jgi:hypothetical protein
MRHEQNWQLDRRTGRQLLSNAVWIKTPTMGVSFELQHLGGFLFSIAALEML